jgi:hypothetical protein
MESTKSGPSIGIGIASRKRAKPALTFDALMTRVELKAAAGAKLKCCIAIGKCLLVFIPEAEEFRQSE